MPTQTKVCTKCDLPKQLDEFPRRKTAKDGRASACLACKGKYREDNKERLRQQAKDYYAAHPELAINRNNVRLYGVSLEEIDLMVLVQGGLCPVCELPLVAGRYARSVDHNHKCCPGRQSCGKCVRGILHMGCNKSLGVIEQWADRGLVQLSEKLLAYTSRGLP